MEKDSKHLTYITLFFLSVLVLFSSFNDPFSDYHNQQFELFYEDENVIIWHSRSLEIKEPSLIEYKIYDRYWNKINKKKIEHKIDSVIGWRTHPNYKPTLGSYSQINVK